MNSFVYCYDEETRNKLLDKKLRLLKEDFEKQEFIFILEKPFLEFEDVGKIYISNKLNF